MKRFSKVILLVFTFLIPIGFILFILFNIINASNFFVIPDIDDFPSSFSRASSNMFILIIPTFLLTLLLDIIMIIIYILNIINNEILDNCGKLLWVVLILFTNFIGMLIYFFKVIQNNNKNNNKIEF